MSPLSLDDLLVELRRRRWTLIRWGEPREPALLAATFAWDTCSDVLVLRAETDASAYRASSWPGADIFAPEKVSYQYHASALWTLRAILSLPRPGTPGAPQAIETPHTKCRVPHGMPKPIIIRPLSPIPRQ